MCLKESCNFKAVDLKGHKLSGENKLGSKQLLRMQVTCILIDSEFIAIICHKTYGKLVLCFTFELK